MTKDLMSDPTEVLANIRDLIEVAIRKQDKVEAFRLARLHGKIEATYRADAMPKDGLDRCDCGSKYWQGRQCVDCQEVFEAGSPE